ncbi:class I SAM-dependent methyltransferase [Parerythrobacter aestuarii]|uniref:class I SAM-dependent methyltransferase n=1 Tax=Parerythrobacter aestuarii TaxID=3020909 RepID=UPI0024DE839F|nr:class I SAM-dependent methyltransferase [Parerythrobacter aestuarii]
MTDKAAWEGRVGMTWATHWSRTDRSFTGLTDLLLARASARPIERVLDIGCGAGELSLALARAHPAAEIVGVDVSEDLVAVARERGAKLPNVGFELGDAAIWQREGFSPDLLVSRHGVMFFDDPVAAFSHLHGIAAVDGRLVFSCFRAVSENLWAQDVVGLLPPGSDEPGDPFAPGPFAFSDATRVEAILTKAGWLDVTIESVDFAFVVGAGEDPIEDALAYFAVIGPAARAASQLGDAEKERFQARLRRYLKRHASGSIVALKAGAWIVAATKG